MDNLIRQTTIAYPIKVNSIAGMSGVDTNVTFQPAPVNSGIIFKRIDLPGQPEVKAHYSNISQTNRNTVLRENDVEVSLVEHLLSSVHAQGIDNMLVCIDGQEIPAMDGSSAPFMFAFQVAGITEQSATKKFLVVERDVKVERETDQARAALSPSDKQSQHYEYELVYQSAAQVLNGKVSFSMTPHNYQKQISRARTYGFLNEIESLTKTHKLHGFSHDNAMYFDQNGALAQEQSFRLRDECTRHKILDAIGDMYLSGYSILGKFSGFKSGHDLNAKLIKKLMASPANYRLVECEVETA